MSVMNAQDRADLIRAVANDDTLSDEDRDRLNIAIDNVPDGTRLPDDLTDVGDGTTDVEIVTTALDYYFG